MKNKLFYLVAIIISSHFLHSSTFAQTPDKLSYQAVIRNTSNQLLANKEVGMKISILQGTASGSPVYVEIFNPNPVTNANGLVSVEIGSGIPLSGNFGTIDWSGGPYFIKTETDPDGGTNYTITGTSQLLSVPYALHAKKAEAIVGGESDPAWKASPSFGIKLDQISNWESAFLHSNKNTGSMHGSTVTGGNLLRLTDPSSVRFLRINADNSVSTLEASDFRSAIGAGTGAGTVISLNTENGITGGPITSMGTIGLEGQALALHNLNANGFTARTAPGVITARSITTSGNGISISNGDGVSGDPTIALNIGQGPAQVAAGNHLHGNMTHDGKIGTSSGRLITTDHGTLEALAGTAEGEMLYWNGTVWTKLIPGQNDQTLAFKNGTPTWDRASNHAHGNITDDGKIGAASGRLITTDHGSLQTMAGTASGEMLYWNGTVWTKLSPGQNDQTLAFKNGTPTWDRAANHTHGNISDDGQIGAAIGRIITTGLGGTLQAMAGTEEGEMLYWSGTQWVRLSPGINGQSLVFINGKPTWWPEATGSNVVVNPTTGRVWMDRNLGASQVAVLSNDGSSYGYLYQWGRDGDGHQIRTSGTTTTISSNDDPGHDKFIRITTPTIGADWRSPHNDNLWQTENNNPCPRNYRVPTEAEWESERLSWHSNDAAGAFGSWLKLPVAGYRKHDDASLSNVGSQGYYWSSTVKTTLQAGTVSKYLYFSNSTAEIQDGLRARGNSVRCIKY